MVGKSCFLLLFFRRLRDQRRTAGRRCLGSESPSTEDTSCRRALRAPTSIRPPPHPQAMFTKHLDHETSAQDVTKRLRQLKAHAREWTPLYPTGTTIEVGCARADDFNFALQPTCCVDVRRECTPLVDPGRARPMFHRVIFTSPLS